MQLTIGERIKEARKRAGMKQSDLAEKIGVAIITIGQYERDKRQPRLEQLEAIATALGTETWELMGYDGAIRIPVPEYPSPIPTKEQVDQMTQSELEYYYLRMLADDAPDELRKRYIDNYNELNKLGQVEAVRRTKELTQLQEYTEADPRATTPRLVYFAYTDAHTPPPEGPSTAPPPDTPETAAEGE